MNRELWAGADRYFESRLLPPDATLDARELTRYDASDGSLAGATSSRDPGTHSDYRRGGTPPEEQIR